MPPIACRLTRAAQPEPLRQSQREIRVLSTLRPDSTVTRGDGKTFLPAQHRAEQGTTPNTCHYQCHQLSKCHSSLEFPRPPAILLAEALLEHRLRRDDA